MFPSIQTNSAALLEAWEGLNESKKLQEIILILKNFVKQKAVFG